MVRRDEMKETSIFTRLVAQVIKNKTEAKGITQTQLGELIGKSKSYVGTRINGQQPWTLDDIDNISVALGYENAFTIFDLARGLRASINGANVANQKETSLEEKTMQTLAKIGKPEYGLAAHQSSRKLDPEAYD